MTHRYSWSPGFALAFAVTLGCGSSQDTTPPPTPAPTGGETTPATGLANTPDAGSAAPVTTPEPTPAPAPPPVTVTAGERRAVPAPTPHVTIAFPANNATVRENRVEVRLNVLHWRDTHNNDDHRHIHLVLDNNPYIRVDDPARPTPLENLSEGTHVLRAFPGWETHESVKTAGAFAMVVFHVGHATAGQTFNPRAPLLTYSRPKGTYNGTDADRILLDFYLTNVPEADVGAQATRVRPTIDGHAMADLTAWVPYYIEHLADGEHTIALDLLGHDGAPVPGLFNHAEQHITVNHQAAAVDPHAAPHAPPTTPTIGAGATPPTALEHPAVAQPGTAGGQPEGAAATPPPHGH